MKFILKLSLLLSMCGMAFASSTVTFPVKHQEVKPYPGKAVIRLNDKTGLHVNAFYSLTCHINNPSNGAAFLMYEYDLITIVFQGTATINGQPAGHTMSLKPGMNTFVIKDVKVISEDPENLVFKNYDNDISIFIEDCKADLTN